MCNHFITLTQLWNLYILNPTKITNETSEFIGEHGIERSTILQLIDLNSDNLRELF